MEKDLTKEDLIKLRDKEIKKRDDTWKTSKSFGEVGKAFVIVGAVVFLLPGLLLAKISDNHHNKAKKYNKKIEEK